MPTYNDSGIVLNSYDLAEADKILSIYTKNNGLVRAVCKGARKSVNKYGAKADQLSCSLFQFAQGKNLDIVCDCELINSFPRVRTNLERLSTGVLFLEVVSNFASEDEVDSASTYELLYNALNDLQETENPLFHSVKFVYNFLSTHGYRPQLESCVSCSNDIERFETESNQAYSSLLGGLLCKKCAYLIDHKKVSNEVMNLIDNINNETKPENQFLRSGLELLQEHINLRSRARIKSFDLVFSL